MIDKKFKNLIVIFVNLIELMSQVLDWRCLKAKKNIDTISCAHVYNVWQEWTFIFFGLLCFSYLEENGYIKVNINGWQRNIHNKIERSNGMRLKIKPFSLWIWIPILFLCHKKEDPNGDYLKKYDIGRLRYLFLAGERLDPDTCHWATDMLTIPVVDHWWQTETDWAIAANLYGHRGFPDQDGFVDQTRSWVQCSDIGLRWQWTAPRRGGRRCR